MKNKKNIDWIIKIGAFNYEIMTVDKINKGGLLGLCRRIFPRIKILRELCPNSRRITLLHELIHAMFWTAGYSPDDEEVICDVVANKMIEIIQDNKEFFIKEFIK